MNPRYRIVDNAEEWQILDTQRDDDPVVGSLDEDVPGAEVAIELATRHLNAIDKKGGTP